MGGDASRTDHSDGFAGIEQDRLTVIDRCPTDTVVGWFGPGNTQVGNLVMQRSPHFGGQ